MSHESTATPWEPPLAGTGPEHLVGSLERLRATFRWKVDDLDEAGLRARPFRSALTLAGLLKHLAMVERHLFTVRCAGEPFPSMPVVAGHDGTDDWEFRSALDDTPADLYRWWDEAVADSRLRLARMLEHPDGLDATAAVSATVGSRVSVRRLVFDLVEEYGRHTGHADLLREQVDARVGEDPPPGWRAVGSRAPAGPGHG